ncbi:MAG: STAS domain-containing protein [Desulfobacterales bacterium]|jgi:anti-anti-sigma factor
MEKVRTGKQNGITVVTVGGHFSRESAPAIMAAYRELIDSGEKKMILRVAPETYFNSESIKILIDIMIDARNQGIQVGIAGLSDHFKKIFQMVGIGKLATFYQTIGGALDCMKG